MSHPPTDTHADLDDKNKEGEHDLLCIEVKAIKVNSSFLTFILRPSKFFFYKTSKKLASKPKSFKFEKPKTSLAQNLSKYH